MTTSTICRLLHHPAEPSSSSVMATLQGELATQVLGQENQCLACLGRGTNIGNMGANGGTCVNKKMPSSRKNQWWLDWTSLWGFISYFAGCHSMSQPSAGLFFAYHTADSPLDIFTLKSPQKQWEGSTCRNPSMQTSTNRHKQPHMQVALHK